MLLLVLVCSCGDVFDGVCVTSVDVLAGVVVADVVVVCYFVAAVGVVVISE